MTGRRLAVTLAAACAAASLCAGSATAGVIPASTAITASSTNANINLLGFISTTCSSTLGFTTPTTGTFPNPATTLGTKTFSSCSLGAVSPRGTWTIRARETGVVGTDTDGNQTTTGELIITLPALSAYWSGTICDPIAVSLFGATITVPFTDNATSFTIASSAVPTDSLNCGPGNALFSGTYTLSNALTIT